MCTGPTNSECSSCISGYFHYSNSSGNYCLLVCPTGYKPNYKSNECEPLLSGLSKAQEATLQATPVVTSAAFLASSVIAGGLSINLMVCLVATESLANMQYLNINHSDIAATLYAGMSSSYVPNWISAFNTLPEDDLIFNWGVFEKNQISALYLDNVGDALTEMMIYTGFFLLALLFTLSSKTEPLSSSSLASKAYVTAFSNLLGNMIGKIQSQILFAVIQIIKLNLFVDSYSRLSLFTAYLTTSILLGVLTLCFFRLQQIFQHKKSSRDRKWIVSEDDQFKSTRIKWLEKKYEFLYGDFKSGQVNHFFFIYWIIGFNPIYILLIFSLQGIPIMQCFSIVIFTLAYLLLSVWIKPFNSKSPAFLHFFNFSCVLAAAVLNLLQPIVNDFVKDFSGTEILGRGIFLVIVFNTGTNALFSLGGLVYEIYIKIKLATSKKKKMILKRG